MDIFTPSEISWMYASNGPARKYHSLCFIDSIRSLVLFGGSDQNIASYNDIKVFSIETNIWQYAVTVDGDIPAERILHSAVCSDSKMYVFGGLHSIEDSPSDSAVWVLTANNATSFTWSKAPIVTDPEKSTGPTARAGHTATIYNNTMYVLGGIGPSSQDSTMYKLDLDKWTWSTTQINGSESSDSSKGGSNTKVLIAAVVSSVLGVICIGIAAFVFYRWNRRRSPLPKPLDSSSATNNPDKHVLIQNDISDKEADSPRNDANEPSSNDSGLNTNNASLAAVGLMTPVNITSSKGAKDYSQEYEQAGYIFMGSTGSTAVHHHGRNADIVTNNYLPPPHSNPSLGSSIMEFSPSMGSVANIHTAATNSNSNSNSNSNINININSNTNSFANIANNEPGYTSVAQTQTHIHTQPQLQPQSNRSPSATEKSAVHADIISSILSSGQPIPAWLREAARRASVEDGSHHEDAPLPPPDAIPNEDQARSMHSGVTNDTQSAHILDPIRYVDVSHVSTTQRSSSMLHNADESASRPLQRRNSELSDLNFTFEARQGASFDMDPMPAIAEPMSPPVPMRMNTLYGELESRGIVVGQADDMQLAKAANRVQHHRVPADDDSILSPLDRLARYHNLAGSWAGESSAAANDRTRASSLLESEGGESADTSRIYSAQPVRRESSDDFLR
ncbi:hypothetical protein FB639_002727 [Coemansia asiatica]|nr:hypothetical protein FB639_002727 [Coemansia asiatica]